MKFNIKKAIKLIALLAAGAAAMTALFSCATKDLQNRTVISFKNSEWGEKRPDWVQRAGINATRLMELPEYKGYVCFVGTARSPNLEFAETWAREFNANQQIARFFQTGVVNLMNARISGEGGSTGVGNASQTNAKNAASTSTMTNKIEGYLAASSVADFSSARHEADFWQYVRTYDPDNRKKYSDEYVAYVLYLIPRDKAEKIAQWYIDDIAKRVPEVGSLATELKSELARQDIDLIKIFDEANSKAESPELGTSAAL